MNTFSGVGAGKAFVIIEAIDKTGAVLNKVGRNLSQFGRLTRQIGMGMLQLGAGGAFALGTSIKAASDLTDELLAMQVALRITDSQMESVTAKVRELGKSTSFTANEVAAAGTELARGGFSKREVEDSLQAVLNLARAGRMEMAPAAKIMVQSMRVFGLESDQASSVADAFAIAAKSGATNIEELAQALSFSGQSAARMGLSLEESLAILTNVSNRMLTSTKAGTSFNQFLTRLATNADKLEKLTGIKAFDVNENAREPMMILREMAAVWDSLSQKKQISIANDVFNIRGQRQVEAISNSIGNISKTIDQMRDGMGEAQKDADKMDSGIGGAVRIMVSAFNDLRQSVGLAFESIIVEKIGPQVVKILNRMSQFVKENEAAFVSAAAGITAFIAAGGGLVVFGTLLSAVGMAVSGITAAVTALTPVIAPVVGFLTVNFGLIAGVVAGAVAALTVVIHGLAMVVQAAWETIGRRTMVFAQRVGTFLVKLGDKFSEARDRLWLAFRDDIRAIQPTVASFFTKLMQSIERLLPTLLEVSDKALPAIVELLAVTNDIMVPLVDLTLRFGNLLMDVIVPALEAVANNLDLVIGKLGELTTGNSAFLLLGQAGELAGLLGKDQRGKPSRFRHIIAGPEEEIELTNPERNRGKPGIPGLPVDEAEAAKTLSLQERYLKNAQDLKQAEVDISVEQEERELRNKREARDRKKAVEDLAMLEGQMAATLDADQKERIAERIKQAKQSLADEEEDREIRRKRESLEELKRIEARKKAESDLAKLRSELLERVGDEELKKIEETISSILPAGSDLLARLRRASKETTRPIDPRRAAELRFIATERARLEELRNRASRSVSFRGEAFQQGSRAAAEKIQEIRQADVRNQLLKSIDERLEDLARLEKDTTKAIREAAGAGV